MIAFSKRNIYKLRDEVNLSLNKDSKGSLIRNHCAILYGGMPTDIKIQQQEMFNNRAVDYMVATDAIAMGLNLNANRIVFQTLAKRHKNKVLQISENDIQQLASNILPNGQISAFNKGDLKMIKNALLPT